jgi:hypothetical protein
MLKRKLIMDGLHYTFFQIKVISKLSNILLNNVMQMLKWKLMMDGLHYTLLQDMVISKLLNILLNNVMQMLKRKIIMDVLHFTLLLVKQKNTYDLLFFLNNNPTKYKERLKLNKKKRCPFPIHLKLIFHFIRANYFLNSVLSEYSGPFIYFNESPQKYDYL